MNYKNLSSGKTNILYEENNFWGTFQNKISNKLFQLFRVIDNFVMDQWYVSGFLFVFYLLISIFCSDFCFVLFFNDLLEYISGILIRSMQVRSYCFVISLFSADSYYTNSKNFPIFQKPDFWRVSCLINVLSFLFYFTHYILYI